MRKLLALALLLPMAAHATIIDFETPGTSDFTSPQSFDGFTFDFDTDGWVTTGDPGCCTKPINTNGTVVAMFGGGRSGPSGSLTMTEDTAALFSLFGFDGASNDDGLLESVTVLGTFADTTTISASFDLTNTFTTFALAGFTDLVSVEFIQGSAGNFFNTSGVVLDNLRLRPIDVPEPGSLLLIGAGLLGFAAGRRRR